MQLLPETTAQLLHWHLLLDPTAQIKGGSCELLLTSWMSLMRPV
jgi:hypothetical protein